MNIQGSIEKALKSDKVGQILGALMAENTLGKSRGLNWLENIDMQLHHAWEDFHFPDLNNVRYDLLGAGPLSGLFKGAITAILAGAIGKELNIHPRITSIANIAANLGTNVALGTAAVAIVDRSTVTHSPTPSNGYGGGSGDGW